MRAPERPANEEARLVALRGYEILDTGREQAFDDLAALAARVCGTSAALISFVDRDRQWFKAAWGVGTGETSRAVSFCGHAILAGDGLMVVPDAHADERFHDNPLVTGAPPVRGYAGAVLRTADGFALGTLCVVDERPLALDEGALDALRRLARQVVSQLELRRSARQLAADLEERRAAEERLADSRARYRELVDNAQGLICAHDLDGVLLMVNRGALALLGYEPHEIVGRNLREFIPPEHRPAFDVYLHTMRREGQFSGLLTLVRADGERVVLAYQNYLARSASGTQVVGHGIEITDRVRMEALNRRMAAVLEATPDFVGIADGRGRPIFLNRAGRALCGLGPDDDISGADIMTIHPEREARQALEVSLPVALERGSWTGESVMLGPGGRRFPVSQVVVAQKKADGTPEFFATVARDISDRIEAERAMIESQGRFRRVVESLKEVLFETDAQGRWTYLNPAWTESTGFPVEESLGRQFLDYVHPDDRDLNRRKFQPLIDRQKDACRHEIRYVTRDGGSRWIEVHARLLTGADGAVTGTSGTLRDVTEQHRLSEQLTRAREEAVAASRMKSEFVANMSHEIRTPINGVLGLTTLLLDTLLTPEQRDYADGVRQSAEALLTIINDILDLSKIEAGKLTVEPIAFDLRPALAVAIEPAIVRARQKGLTVDLRLAPDLPAQVVGDPVRIRQVLLNLTDNAVKFTTRGVVSIQVTSVPPPAGPRAVPRPAAAAGDGLQALARAPRVRFAVSDSGIGIPHEKLGAIFDKFTQGDSSTSRQYGGSGLGLAICRQLVELMQGQIGVESRAGEGSTFWFTLPLPAAGQASAHGSAPAAVPGPSASLRHWHVLLAEDNTINQKVARRFLEKAGCTVDIVENGEEAVAAMEARAYDAVFMDCQMPRMDGYEATRRIRRLPNGETVPVVAMTANAMRGDRERCLACGMTDYLAKPLQPETVRVALDRIPPGAPLPPSAVPAATVAAAFDASEIVNWFDHDLEAVIEVVGLLVRDLPIYVGRIKDAAAAGDLDTVARVAHTIKGAVGNVAATTVAGIAEAIEDAVAGDRPSRVVALCGPLDGAVAELTDELQQWARGLAGAAPAACPAPEGARL